MRLARLLCAATALGAPLPVRAQSAQPVPQADMTLQAQTAQDRAIVADETLVVQAQRRNQTQVIQGGQLGALGNQKALDVPFQIKSYSASLIRNQQSQTLGEVLENDPSIRTTLGYGNYSEIFVIRGFPLDSDDVSVDGLYGVAPRQLVDPALYDQVQVLNGANAFLNGAAPGSSGIGGGVNLMLKQAADTPLTRLTGMYTSNATGGGAIDVGRRFGRDNAFGARINVTGYSGRTAIDHEHVDSLTVGGAFDWRGERARVGLDVDYQDKGVTWGREPIFIGSTATRVPGVPSNTTNYGQPWTYTRLKDIFGVLHGEYDLTDVITAYGAFGARNGDEQGDYSSVTVSDIATGAGTAGQLYVPYDDDSYSLRGGIRWHARTGPISHEINLGGQSLWQSANTAYGYSPGVATDIYDTAYTSRAPYTLVAGDLNDPGLNNRTRMQSVFGSDTLKFWDGRVSVIVGARAQSMLIRSYNSYGDGAETARYDSSRVTPVVGLVVHPTQNTALYFNRIEGLAEGSTAPAGATNTGEIFPPYDSVQYEVGAKYQIARFATSLALFTTSQPNAYSQGNVDGTSTFVVDGDQRNRGIEWSFNGEPVHGLRLIGGVTYLDATVQNSGSAATDDKTAIGVPSLMANGNVEWDTPFVKGLTLTGRVIYTGKQEVDAINTLHLPDWTRFDLGARYTFLAARKPLTLRLGVDNVANTQYWASAFGGYLLQGLPRTYKLSVSVDL